MSDGVRKGLSMRHGAGDAARIVVVGGGVAGLTLATLLGQTLGRRGVAGVSLVDRSDVRSLLRT